MCNVKPYGYIYITTNLINGKRYIGQKAYNYFVDSYKGSGKYLRKAIDKYGWDNFKTEVIEWCRDQEELDNCERYWIALYDAVNSDKFYNLAAGGSGHVKGSKLSEETKKKISQNNARYNLGKHMSEESKRKLSESNKGKKRTDEWKHKMSVRFKGDNNPNYGKTISDEQKLAISKANKGRHHTESAKKLMSEARKGENNAFYGKHHTEETRQKLKDAWVLRRLKGVSMETRQKQSKQRMGEKNHFYGKTHTTGSKLKISQANSGRCYVTNDLQNKRVKLEELDYYLSIGYHKGRTIKTKYAKRKVGKEL